MFAEEFTRLKEEIPDSLIDAHLTKKKKKEAEKGDSAKEATESKTDETNEKKGIQLSPKCSIFAGYIFVSVKCFVMWKHQYVIIS